jgi:hypothetical protein
MTEYRLANHLANLEDCPPDGFDECEQEAFRFVNNPISSEDFLTHFEKSPNNHEGRCLAYSLSFFDSLESAKRRYAVLKESIPNFRKRAGNCIARGQLYESDGKSSSTDCNGHFSFFEYSGNDLVSRFEIVERL